MKFLFASDSFKGSLSSEQTISLLTEAAKNVFGQVECDGVPVADGGEGTTDAVLHAVHGERVSVAVHGPLLEQETAYYGKLSDAAAILEMASASGLPMVPEEKRNPLETTTYGTGELLRAVLSAGHTDISVAIGGSATNDGGMGCMRALGVRFLDASGNELEGRGRDLGKVVDIDLSELDPRVKAARITVMCDVTNPLCGKNGATYTFGKQKGGTPEILEQLEAGMQNYRSVLQRTFGIDPDEITGAGAAGGLGAAFRLFLNGELRSGIETVLDLIGFSERLQGVDLVVTGEGRTDWQSCCGKVVQGIGNRCRAAGVPAVVLSGSAGTGAEKVFNEGICSLMTTVNSPMELAQALENAEQLYFDSAVRMFRFLRTGMGMGRIRGNTMN